MLQLWSVCVCVCVCVCLLLARPAAAAVPTLCVSGRQQSPVDIQTTRSLSGQPLRFDYRPSVTRVVNDGHTVRLRTGPGSVLWLGKERLALQQLHFHLPGGERLQGEDFPMAMHLLHRAPSGQLVPLVLLFRRGAQHPALTALLPRLPGVGRPEHALNGPVPDLAALLPPGGAYFAYTGSLTAPPCTEGVRWIVLQQVQTVSGEQLEQLHALFADNARPVQPLNGRVVFEHP
jgi:carbonic anhydrase